MRLWDGIVRQMGGLYDSITGELIELRAEVAGEQLRKDLVELFRSDFILFPEIWSVQVESNEGVAKWDGASQAVVGFGWRLLNALDVIVNQDGGFLEPELFDALTMGVVMEDMDGAVIFENVQGIEVVRDVDIYAAPDETEETGNLLSDQQKIRVAVKDLLIPLFDDPQVASFSDKPPSKPRS